MAAKHRKALLIITAASAVLICVSLFVMLNTDEEEDVPAYANRTERPIEAAADWLEVVAAVCEAAGGNMIITDEQHNSRSYAVAYSKDGSRIADAALTVNYYEDYTVDNIVLDFNLLPNVPAQSVVAPIDSILANEANALFSDACKWSIALVKAALTILDKDDSISLKAMHDMETALHKALETGAVFEYNYGAIQLGVEPMYEKTMRVSIRPARDTN